MRAIIIDPFDRTLTEVEHDGAIKSIYTILRCTTFDIVRAEWGAEIFVDDDGLGVTYQKFFEMGDTILAGRALILGSYSKFVDGELEEGSCDAPGTLDHWRARVRWRNLRFTGMKASEGYDETPFGRVFVIRNEAQFEEIDDVD